MNKYRYLHRSRIIPALFLLVILMGAGMNEALSQTINLTVSIDNGLAGNTTDINGSGFTPGTIAANSITVGGFATTHALITVDGSGNFSATTLTLPSLVSGSYTVIVQGVSFTNRYRVADITLSSTAGAGATGETTQISGSFFTPSSTIPANSITVGGSATTHALINVTAGGTFSATAVTLLALTPGIKTVVVAGVSFAGEYRVADITLTPNGGENIAGVTTQISGILFTPSSTIPANSILVGGLATTHALINVDAGGTFAATTVTLPLLTVGLKDVVVQALTFVQHYRVADITLVAAAGDGFAGNTTQINGSGFPASGTIPANSITVDGSATIHALINISAGGVFAATTVTLPALTGGLKDVVVSGISFGQNYRVADLTLTPDHGNGTNGNTTQISGVFLTPSSTIPANSITVGGSATIHALINVSALGSFTATPVTLPALTVGLKDVVAQGIIFKNNYRISTVTLVPTSGNGNSGATFAITGQGFVPGTNAIAANSITVGGFATIHSARTVAADGSFTSINPVTLPNLFEGTHSVVVQGDSFANAYSVTAQIVLSPNSGTGAPNQTFGLTGSGFTVSLTIPANSVTVGGSPTTHISSTTGAGGNFSSVTVTITNNLPTGIYNVVVGGKTFTGYYSVYPAISLSVTTGNGVTGQTTNIVGSGFAPSTIAANSITFENLAVIHSAITIPANGFLPSTTLTLPYLPAGALDVRVDDGSVGVYTFVDTFTVSPAVTLGANTGNGNNVGNSMSITSGTGFTPGVGSVPANSMSLRYPGAVTQTMTHPAFDVNANGRLNNGNPLTINPLPYLPGGVLNLRITHGGTTNVFIGVYTVTPTVMSLAPATGNGALNNATAFASGIGFVPPNVGSSTIKFFDSSISVDYPIGSAAIAVGANGVLNIADPLNSLSLPYMNNGQKTVKITMQNGTEYSFPAQYTVTRNVTADPNTGNGLAGNFSNFSFTGFTSSSTVAANSWTIGGTAVNQAITIAANGSAMNVAVTLPSLPLGVHAVFAQGNTFPAVYTVQSDLICNPTSGMGYNGRTISITGTGFPQGTIPANSITFSGYSATHGAITIPVNGILPATNVSLPYLPEGDQPINVDGTVFTDRYSVTPIGWVQPHLGLNNTGTVVSLYAWGLTPGTVPANSVTMETIDGIQSFSMNHQAFTVDSHGTFPNVIMTLGQYQPIGPKSLRITYTGGSRTYLFPYSYIATNTLVTPTLTAIGLVLLLIGFGLILLAYQARHRRLITQEVRKE